MSSIKKYNLLLGFLVLWAMPGLAQLAPPPVLPLDSVLQRINRRNPMLQMSEQKAKAADAMAEGARSLMAPMVGGGMFMAPYPGAAVSEERDRGAFMVSAEQEIPHPAKLNAREDYLKSRSAIEKAGRDVTFNNLRAEAKTAYYTWVVLEKKKALIQENKRIMAYMLKLAKIRYPYSQSKLGSVYKAEARLYESANMEEMTANAIQQQNVQLNMLMNLPKDSQYRIDTQVVVPQPVNLAVDSTFWTGTRSDLRQLDKTVESMQLNVRMEQLERRPDFRVRFDHMSPRDKMMPRQFTAMGMISIPIAPWSSKMYKANTKAMNLEIEAMQRERESIVNEAEAMIRSMGLELNTMHHHLHNYQHKIIPALQKNYDVTMLAYEQNKAELPEVLDAWEALNMARMGKLDDLQALYKMTVDYEKQLEK
jgi:cobalt-zinc-cadmium efflux system outer membrane protein